MEQINLNQVAIQPTFSLELILKQLLHMSDPISFEIKKNDFYINGLQPDDTQGNVVVNQLWKQK